MNIQNAKLVTGGQVQNLKEDIAMRETKQLVLQTVKQQSTYLLSNFFRHVPEVVDALYFLPFD